MALKRISIQKKNFDSLMIIIEEVDIIRNISDIIADFTVAWMYLINLINPKFCILYISKDADLFLRIFMRIAIRNFWL